MARRHRETWNRLNAGTEKETDSRSDGTTLPQIPLYRSLRHSLHRRLSPPHDMLRCVASVGSSSSYASKTATMLSILRFRSGLLAHFAHRHAVCRFVAHSEDVSQQRVPFVAAASRASREAPAALPPTLPQYVHPSRSRRCQHHQGRDRDRGHEGGSRHGCEGRRCASAHVDARDCSQHCRGFETPHRRRTGSPERPRCLYRGSCST